MKSAVSIAAAIAILAFSWILTFGIPMLQGDAIQDGNAPVNAGPPGEGARRAGGTTLVTSAIVEEEAFVDAFRSVGVGKANASVLVAAEVAGRVTELHFGANMQVTSGDALVTLDRLVEEIALRTARASLSELEATLKRYDSLQQTNSGAVSQVSVDEATTQVELARAALARAEYDLSQKTIRAPISGTLGLSDIEIGTYLTVSSEIVKITDQSSIIVEFGLPDRAAGLVKIGQKVRLTTGSLPGRVFEAQVSEYDGQVDNTTRTIKVRATVDNAEGQLVPGMIFNVVLISQNAPLPVVPATAITWSRDGAAVWIIDGDKVRAESVVIRHRANDRVWLNGALSAGQLVVVEGVQKLRDGASVIAGQSEALSRLERGAGEGES